MVLLRPGLLATFSNHFNLPCFTISKSLTTLSLCLFSISSSTEWFALWSLYMIPRILVMHFMSKASMFFSVFALGVQVSEAVGGVGWGWQLFALWCCHDSISLWRHRHSSIVGSRKVQVVRVQCQGKLNWSVFLPSWGTPLRFQTISSMV